MELVAMVDQPIMNTTTTVAGPDTTVAPMRDVLPSASPQAQLMLLQLLAQVKFLQEICKPHNESSPAEEALRTLARDAIEREQDMKRQLKAQERTSAETVANLTAQLNDTMKELHAAQELNKNLSVSLKNKEKDMQELQEKIKGLEKSRAKKLQEVLKGQTKEEALIRAAKRGNIDEMSIIMNDGTVNLEYSDLLLEWTALEWAVSFGHTQACRLLLERGANPRRVLSNGKFGSVVHWPLRLAARFGHLEIASLLLQYDAELPSNFLTFDGTDIYDEPEKIASSRGFLELAQMLCEWKDNNNCHYLTDKYVQGQTFGRLVTFGS